MAINVDIVYKTVLSILNKEQRGYLTPDEFNKVATQVQLEIFEKYFEDLNQQMRVPENDSEYANRVKTVKEKIAFFETQNPLLTGYILPSDLHRLGSIEYKPIYGPMPGIPPGWPVPSSTLPVECQEFSQHEFNLLTRSRLTTPTTAFPGFTRQGDVIAPAPNTIAFGELECYYVRKPLNVRWGYTEGGLGQYVYDDTVFVSTGINLGVGSLTSSITGALAGAVFPATYINPTFSTTSVSGTGARFSISTTAVDTCTIDVLLSGSDYVVGDQITIDNDELGLGSTGPTITLTAANLMSGSALGSTDFEISNLDQVETILNILMYSGVIIRDPQIIQTAAALVKEEEINQKS